LLRQPLSIKKSYAGAIQPPMHVFGTLSCKSTAIFLLDFDIFFEYQTMQCL
jgi:hypothetical protein